MHFYARQNRAVKLGLLTHLDKAWHSGHRRAVSRGSAKVWGAAGPLPAAFMGRLHTEGDMIKKKNKLRFKHMIHPALLNTLTLRINIHECGVMFF